MAVDIAGQIEKEYGLVSFSNPVIHFGFNTIEIAKKTSLYQNIFLAGSIVTVSFFLLLINPPAILAVLMIIGWGLAVFYNYYDYFDTVIINFHDKEIIFDNKFRLVNIIRRKLLRTTSLAFNEVSHFEVRGSGFSIKQETRTQLVAKSFDHLPLTLAAFRFERDARRLGELLQHYITDKPAASR